MARVNSLLRRFRQERTVEMMDSHGTQTAAIANRIARKLRAEHGGSLSPAQKGGITRKAWKEAEIQARELLKKRRARLDAEIEAERERLIMLHCPPDTPEGRAAKVANEERQRFEEEQRKTEHAEKALQRQQIDEEKRTATARRKAEAQSAADKRLAEVMAHREANPPQRKFKSGEEPAGWKPHMDQGGLDRFWLEGVAEDADVDEEPSREIEVHPLTLALRKKAPKQVP